MVSDTLTYLQNSELWNILEVFKLKIKNSLDNKYIYIIQIILFYKLKILWIINICIIQIILFYKLKIKNSLYNKYICLLSK